MIWCLYYIQVVCYKYNKSNLNHNHTSLKNITYTIFIPVWDFIVAVSCDTRGPVQKPINRKRPQSLGQNDNRVASWLVVTLPWRRVPRNPAVTTGAPTAAHRVPIIRTFQRNAGLFAGLGEFLKTAAAGPVRQTSHIFKSSTQTCRGDRDRDRDTIPFHKRTCPKTSGPTVLYSPYPNSEGQGAVGQSHFL